jgi:EmrB/QacA subfamily drug resistance transporter
MPEASAASPHPKSPDQAGLHTAASSRPWVLAAVVTTLFIAAMEATIVATAMPPIVGELGGFDLFSWVFTSYLLAQAITIPTYGRLADLFGRKRVLFAGLFLFLVGSVLCGFAWNMPSLIGFRILQGIGAGALIPVGVTIVGDIYSAAERARIQGFVSSAWTVAAVIGPVLGAFLVAHGSWPLVFWINVPLGVIATVMLALTLRETIVPRRHQIDYGGSILMTLGTGLLMFAFVQAATLPGTTVAALIGAGAILLIALCFYEQRVAEPLLPSILWRDRIIAGGSLAGIAMGPIMIGSSVFLSIYMQVAMGETAFVAGVVLAAVSFSWVFGSVPGGWLMLRFSYRAAVAVGGVTLIVGSLVLAFLDPARGPVWAGVGGFIIGIGLGLSNNTFTVAAQAAVEWGQRGIATSHLSFMRVMGQALGAALFGGVLNYRLAGQMVGEGDVVNRLMDPALRQALPVAELAPLTTAIGAALNEVYVLQALFSLIALLTALTLPAGLSPLHPAGGQKRHGSTSKG